MNARPKRLKAVSILTALTVAFAALAVTPTRIARAEDVVAAKRHFERGEDLYLEGRFLEAAKEFELGYQKAPRPKFLYNIGTSYRRAQELEKAKEAYETLLRIDPGTEYRAEVEEIIRTIDDALEAKALAAAPAPAPPTPPPAPPQKPILIDIPPPVTDVELPAGPSEPRSLWSSPWFWGVVGVVVAAGVAGTVYGFTRGSGCGATECFVERQPPPAAMMLTLP